MAAKENPGWGDPGHRHLHHHPLFRQKEIRPGLFRIEEHFFDSWNKANIFFIKGADRDLLVDTGKELGFFSHPTAS